MGLCKCPKRKVTNLFCFEHRVNVCEYCLVSNHQKCVVKSYLHWLQDSDYSPNCSLCSQSLVDEQLTECVRLVCYDVFHLECLSRQLACLPSTTTPAGFQCPTCSGPVFPAPNVASPVVDALKSTLSAMPWARNGLGLPPLSEGSSAQSGGTPVRQAAGRDGVAANPSPSPSVTSLTGSRPVHPVQPVRSMTQSASDSPSAMSAAQSSGGMQQAGVTSRGGVDTTGPAMMGGTPQGFRDSFKVDMGDADEDKYKKRSAFSFLSRWLKSRSIGGRGAAVSSGGRTSRRLMLAGLVFVAFLTLLILFSQMGEHASDGDPLLDPMANPNIRVEDVKG